MNIALYFKMKNQRIQPTPLKTTVSLFKQNQTEESDFEIDSKEDNFVESIEEIDGKFLQKVKFLLKGMDKNGM